MYIFRLDYRIDQTVYFCQFISSQIICKIQYEAKTILLS